jgi:hypothetical protein
MKDTFYFSHDYNTRADEKIKLLIRKHGMLGYGIFWAIIEDLYNNANALQTDYEGIAFDLRADSEMVKSIINDFNLFIINGDCFGSESVDRRLKERIKKSKQASESANYRWNNANAMRTQCDSNAIKESKGKKSKVNKIKIRKENFKEDLKPFLEIYGKDLLNDFFRYWTETNQGGKKMRFEMEKVFEISKRLKTWSNNENKFKKVGGMASEREKRIEGVRQLKADAAAILDHLNIKLS